MMFLVLAMITVNFTSVFANPKGLSPAEISLRLQAINSKYDINEQFSKEDAEFVKRYAINLKKNNSQTIRLYSASSEDISMVSPFNVVGSSSENKSKAQCIGKIWVDSGVINHKWGGEFTTTIVKGGKVKSIKNEISHVVYGVIGSDGFGKVYDRTLSCQDTNTKQLTIKESESYSAVAAYATINAKATIKYDGGSYVVTE